MGGYRAEKVDIAVLLEVEIAGDRTENELMYFRGVSFFSRKAMQTKSA